MQWRQWRWHVFRRRWNISFAWHRFFNERPKCPRIHLRSSCVCDIHRCGQILELDKRKYFMKILEKSKNAIKCLISSKTMGFHSTTWLVDDFGWISESRKNWKKKYVFFIVLRVLTADLGGGGETLLGRVMCNECVVCTSRKCSSGPRMRENRENQIHAY